jgi:hypothetical protein
MSNTDQLIQFVGALPDSGDDAELANGLFAVLAAVLAKLPKHRQEAQLRGIERELRDAVWQFEGGNPWLQ